MIAIAPAGPRIVATIGVYGFTAATFREVLERARVVALVDVRRRRGVRGAQYAWANSRRLQDLLADAGIAYSHHLELAPTNELRQLLYREDERHGIGRRNRVVLAPEYVRRYTAEILDPADLDPLIAEFEDLDSGIGALMCVETAPSACHRSLIAARLTREHGFGVLDLVA